MWSHYADSHRGICLGFDVPDHLLRPIEYVDDVLVLGNIMRIGAATESERQEYVRIIDRSFWVKYRRWCYEDEVRMHGERKEKDWDGNYYVYFDENLKLKEVIAGVKCYASKYEIMDALNGYAYAEEVQIGKAARANKTFEIVVDEKGFYERR
jgi:hypothetical protein